MGNQDESAVPKNGKGTLSATGLVKAYGRRDVLNGVSIHVSPGEVVGLIGESGSGKTTLVRSALGLLPFQDGQVDLLGQDLRTLPAKSLRTLRREVQLLFQHVI